jgi:hypothetical protein
VGVVSFHELSSTFVKSVGVHLYPPAVNGAFRGDGVEAIGT